jgi:hypothetical protein
MPVKHRNICSSMIKICHRKPRTSIILNEMVCFSRLQPVHRQLNVSFSFSA